MLLPDTGGTKLLSFSDEQIELVVAALHTWSVENHADIDSAEGRRALTVAIDVVQTNPTQDLFPEEFSKRLGA